MTGSRHAPIPEATVATVVGEVSERMREPTYAQLAIGELAEAHPDVARFLAAHANELGGGEGVMHAVFHAHVLAECIGRHREAGPRRPIRFRDLDAASHGDPRARLREQEPALADYVASNVEGDALHGVLALVTLALVDAR